MKTQLVPVAHWRLVPEQVIERVPVTVCHMERDVITIKVPRLVVKHVPKVLIYKKAVMTVEEYPVTVYRPVVKRVPVVGPSSQFPSGQLESPGDVIVPAAPPSRPATEEKDAAKVPAEPEGAVSPFAPATPKPPTPAPPRPAPGGGAAPASAKPPKAAE